METGCRFPSGFKEKRSVGGLFLKREVSLQVAEKLALEMLSQETWDVFLTRLHNNQKQLKGPQFPQVKGSSDVKLTKISSG